MKTFNYNETNRRDFNEDIKGLIRAVYMLEVQQIIQITLKDDNTIFSMESIRLKDLYIFDDQMKVEFENFRSMFLDIGTCKTIEIELIDRLTSETIAKMVYKA